MTGAAFHRGSSVQTYSTPPEFLAAVEREHGEISFDLAASPENSVAAKWFSETDNSLVQDWTKLHGLLWLNPPFSNIRPWAKKCLESRESNPSTKIAFLVPASVGSGWYRDYVHARSFIRFLNGRLKFDGCNPYPKDCMLCLFGYPPGFGVWKWK